MRKTYYYLECDGQIFLLKRGKRWTFPSRRRELPCRIQTLFRMPFREGQVLFCKPHLKRHPFHWMHKDDVIGRADVAPVVQRAVNRSLPRAAAKVAIVENGKVLMVKAARGLTRGYWNLPGGFVGYGEHPAECARREAYEELGVRVRLGRLLGVFSDVFRRSGGYMISFVFLGKRGAGRIVLEREEIESYQWMSLQKALRSTRNPFAKAGLRAYLRSERRK